MSSNIGSEIIEYQIINKVYIKQSFMFCSSILTIGHLALIMFILFPLVFPNQYQLPLLYYISFLSHNKSPYYELNYLFQSIAIYSSCEILVTFDLTIFNLMSHSQKKIDILLVNLQNLDQNISEYVAKRKPYEVVEEKFRIVIELHKKTITFITKLQSCISVIIFAQFLTNVYGICLSMNGIYEVHNSNRF